MARYFWAGMIAIGSTFFLMWAMAQLLKAPKSYAPPVATLAIRLQNEPRRAQPKPQKAQLQIPAPAQMDMHRPPVEPISAKRLNAAILGEVLQDELLLPSRLNLPALTTPRLDIEPIYQGAAGQLKLITPLFRIQPSYPEAASRAGLRSTVEVDVSFIVDRFGKVTSISFNRVSVKEPWRRFFIHEVERSLQQWRYAPQGKAQTDSGVRQRILFKFTRGGR